MPILISFIVFAIYVIVIVGIVLLYKEVYKYFKLKNELLTKELNKIDTK